MTQLRADYSAILRAVPAGSRVLDVGCGDGELLALLKTEKAAAVRGMEISQKGVNESVARGLSVIQGDADQELGIYPDNAFDVVILSRTIQAMRRPLLVLREMRRIGRRAIVSVPNFGHWRVRLTLLLGGRMPVTKELPASWHETDNIHLCTLLDMVYLATEAGWAIEAVTPVHGGKPQQSKPAVSGLDNLLAAEAVFFLKRE